MKVLNRALIDIERKKLKTVIFFLVIFLLSSLLSGALFVRNFIFMSETNLRASIPPVAVLEQKMIHWNGPLRFPSYDMIEEISNLPHVLTYDVTATLYLYSRNLDWLVADIEEELTAELQSELNQIRFQGFRLTGGTMEMFSTQGVRRSQHVDFEGGLLSLVSGRFFTQEELDQGTAVVVVSRQWAEKNNLEVGSAIVLESFISDVDGMSEEGIHNFYHHWHDEQFYLFHEELEVEIIGLFEVALDLSLGVGEGPRFYQMLMEKDWLLNRFYLPFILQESIARRLDKNLLEGWELSEDFQLVSSFLLDSSTNFRQFSEAAAAVLPENWEVVDVSQGLGPIFTVFDQMQLIGNHIFIGGVVATVFTLGGTVLLYLSSKRKEIGLYISLGESKFKILFQLLLEILLPGLLAISLSLFVGQWVSSLLSSAMIEQELASQLLHQRVPAFHHLPQRLQLFNPGPMSLEDMVSALNTSVNIKNLVFIFSIQVGTILIATIIPCLCIWRLSPQKILL